MKTKDLSAKSLAELTAIYNQHADKPIKKFTGSKADAVKRVLAVLPKTQAGEKKPRGQGIGKLILERLEAGDKPAAVLEAVKKAFPDSQTTMKSVYWYNSRRRQA